MVNSNKNHQSRVRRQFFRSALVLISIQLCFAFTVFAQNITVKGKVTDASSGEELPGVNVVVKGTTAGTITMADGTFSIQVNSNGTLMFSFIGFKPKEVPVNGQPEINVNLEQEATQLDEVIAVGYGTARRGDLTGSVSTVSAETLKKIPVADAAEAIKGRLPGVNIITTDGSPDAEIVIRVRGGGSVTQDNSPLYVVDGFIVSSIRDIPPTDIANITVLKDAAATAIYGAQAANGVILITTKSPVEGRTSVSYNGYVQVKTLPQERKYEVLDPYEYVMMQYEYAKMRSESDLRNFEKYYGKYDDLELYQYKPYTDWQDELFGEPTISQSHNLSVSGGTAKTKISLSLSNNIDEGIMIGNGYRRNVINFKLNHDISNKLKLDASARITDTKVDGSGTSGSSQLRVKNVVTARPVNGIADELDIDLNFVDSEDDYQNFLLSLINPVQLAEQDWRQRNTKNYVLQGGVTWEATKELTLKSTISGSQTFDERLRYYGPLTSESQQQGNSLPLGTINNSDGTSMRWLNTAQYVFENLGDHKLDLMLGHEVYSNGGKSSAVRVENFRESMTPKEMFANMSLGEVLDSYSTEESTQQNRLSFFGRANYQFREKYLLTATLRSDASSKFSKDNRVGIFPAVAFGWKINQESFMSGADKVDELKLRLSYGATVNDRISANATKFLFGVDTNNGPGMGTNTTNAYYKPSGSTLYNPNLVWETTINSNIGLDFMFFKGRISGSLDAYNNKTKDLLLASAISPISGFSTQWNNIGSTSNKGVELMFNATLIESNDFSLRTNINFGINKGKIDELDGTDERFIQSNWASTDLKDRDDYYLAVGKTIGLMYGYVNDGMYTVDDFSGYNELKNTYTLKDGIPDASNTLGAPLRPGSMKIKDISGPDGVPDGVINSLDRKVIGSALPDAFGGFSFEANWKGFDASVLFNWMIGNDIYNSGKIDYNQLYRTYYGNMLTSMSSDKRFTYIDVDGSITGEAGGLVTDLEQLRTLNADKTIWSGSTSFGQATAVVTDWAIEDGSFLRLSTVTLGYTLPETWSKKLGMSNLRFYATGYNLWLWTKYSGYDPEVSTSRSSTYGALIQGLDYSSYPRSRSFTFGVNVTF